MASRRLIRSPPVGEERSALGVTAYTSRIVSLNCRTLPKPAANAMSAALNDAFEQRPAVRARCARDGLGSGAEFLGEQPRDVPLV